MSVQLAANDVLYPGGTPYYVLFQPKGGTPYPEYWAVNEGGPWTIGQVKQITNPTPGLTINTLQHGTATPPSNGLGNNGDFYLQTATECLYGPKVSSAWPTPCLSLIGVAGSSGSTGPVGPPVTFRNAWSSAIAYAVGDAVSLAGSSYIATASNINHTPPNASFWGVLAQLGASGAPGAVGGVGPVGAVGSTGPQGNPGLQGVAGSAATVAVGTTSTGTAAVTNSGSSSAAVLNFTVPQGTAGTNGTNGVVSQLQNTGTPVTPRAKFNIAHGVNTTVVATDNGIDTTTFTIDSNAGGGSGAPNVPGSCGSGATTSCVVTITSLNINTLDSAIALCHNTAGFFTPTISSTSGSSPINTVTLGYSSASGVVCTVNSNGGAGPAGASGSNGSNGSAATVAVGTTTTGPAAVSNSGSSSAAVLNFTVPQGVAGSTGPQGNPGVQGIAGAAATVAVGTTSSGAAAVSNSGSPSAAVFNFTVPTGAVGATGSVGTSGANGNTVLNGSSAPGGGTGVNGDYYLLNGNCIYGPKASGAWPGSCTSLIGPAGAVGGTGAAGNTVLSGFGSPVGGNNLDFYIDKNVPCIYGPKASGIWPLTCTPLVGPAGPAGTNGTNGIAGATGPSGPASLTPTGTGLAHVTGGALDGTAYSLASGDIPANAAPTSGSAGGLLTGSGLAGAVLLYSGARQTVLVQGGSVGPFLITLPPYSAQIASLSGLETLSNKTVDGISPTILGYLANLTADLQTTLNLKQPIITTGAATSYLAADLSIKQSCGGCTLNVPVCWSGTAFYTSGCVSGGGALSWAALTSGSWSTLTSSAWSTLHL